MRHPGLVFPSFLTKNLLQVRNCTKSVTKVTFLIGKRINFVPMRRGLGWGMICIAMLGGWSCSQKEHAPPREGVLPLPTIASILADIHLAEAAVAMQALTFQESLSRYDYYEREIMRRHQTDTATYRRSYEFYAADANQLAQLMKIVADTLTARRKALH